MANRAYRQLAGARISQVYILEGGIPAWLALFAGYAENGNDPLAAGSLGGRYPASYPHLKHTELPKFEPTVK
jgi:3-mercaptopyruvate sulfurtransferase SseA